MTQELVRHATEPCHMVHLMVVTGVVEQHIAILPHQQVGVGGEPG